MARKQAMMRYMDAMLVAEAKIENVAEWCRTNGVCPRTFYRHRARVRAEGQWQPRSRRPKTSPQATAQEVVDQVLLLRAELGPDNGADSIRPELIEVAAGRQWEQRGLVVPSRATINRILDRHGLLAKNPGKRPRASWRRFCYARPRDCYQIDGTEYRLVDGTTAVAIDVIDDCSRVWVAGQVTAAETTEAGLAALRAASAQFGPPGLVLADNGSAFAHRHRGRDKSLTCRFSRTVAEEFDTRVIYSSPYHPQTLGKCERLHQTAAKLLTHFYPQPPTSLAELQTRLDRVREHYNTHRRHSALANNTPLNAWQAAPTHGGPADLPRQTDATVHRLRVVSNGTITLGEHILSIGRAHAHNTITVLRNGDRVTAFNLDGDTLGALTLRRDQRYQGTLTPAA